MRRELQTILEAGRGNALQDASLCMCVRLCQVWQQCLLRCLSVSIIGRAHYVSWLRELACVLLLGSCLITLHDV